MLTATENKIWRNFLNYQEHDFREVHGYGKDEIKRVGISKFIQAHGWDVPSHCDKWRKNVLKVVICPACENGFGVFDDNLGLCETCLKEYDMNKFYDELDLMTKDPEIQQVLIANFFATPAFREKFKKKEEDFLGNEISPNADDSGLPPLSPGEASAIESS